MMNGSNNSLLQLPYNDKLLIIQAIDNIEQKYKKLCEENSKLEEDNKHLKEKCNNDSITPITSGGGNYPLYYASMEPTITPISKITVKQTMPILPVSTIMISSPVQTQFAISPSMEQIDIPTPILPINQISMTPTSALLRLPMQQKLLIIDAIDNIESKYKESFKKNTLLKDENTSLKKVCNDKNIRY
jgi:regulator of replication initiation timing